MSPTGEWGARRFALCSLAVLLTSSAASGMLQSQNSQQRADGTVAVVGPGHVLQDYLSMVLAQEAQRKQNRASGWEGIHPLNRRYGDESAEVRLARRQAAISAAVASAAPTVAPAAAAVSPVAAAAATPASASASLPAVIPWSSNPTAAKSTALPSPTKTTPPPSGFAGYFSTQNKLFPAAVAACIAIGLVCLLFIVAIAKMVTHAKMSPEEKRGEYGEYTKKRSGGLALRSANTLRRAFTTKKLGSFARRNKEGSVLIDVGDEVLAVRPEVAHEFEREKSMLGESGGNGSRLTSSSLNPNNLRQALRNAEMIVAANNAPSGPAVPRGFDINTWRTSSASLPTIKDSDEGKEELARGISQRLTDGLRSLRGERANNESTYSFDSEKQMPGGLREAQVPISGREPVITRGAREWDIQPQQQPVERVLQSKSSQDTLCSDELSHTRHTLTDAPVPRLSVKRKSTVAGHSSQQQQSRPKSILIKRDQTEQPQGSYRHRAAAAPERSKTTSGPKQQISSTSPASPKMLQHRTSIAASKSQKPVSLKPSIPDSSQIKVSDTRTPHTREIFRPLPPPPPFSPLT